MIQVLQHVRDSQTAKICLLLGFCFITTIIFISRSDSGTQASDKPQKQHPNLHLMSAEEETPTGEAMTGGLGQVHEKDDEVTEVVEKIKPILEEKSGKKFESLEVIHYKPQTVAGRNYFVKAKAKLADGEEQIVHLRIYRDLKKNLELTAFQLDRKLEETLAYFQ